MRAVLALTLILLVPLAYAVCDGSNYPYFLHTFPASLEAFEGLLFYYDVNASDALYSTQLTYGILTDPGDLPGMTINSSTGTLNFTPQDHDTGSHNIQYYVQNPDGCNNMSDLLVLAIRDAPNISATLPASATPQIYENITTTFNVTIYDKDSGDIMNFTWYVNGEYNSTGTELNYTPSYCSAGTHSISVLVNDTFNLSVQYNWTVTVLNSNRPPVLNGTIPDINWTENTNLTNAINLSDYFYDDDLIECDGDSNSYLQNLTYTASGNSQISVLIGSTTYFNVSFLSPGHWAGKENITFTADDGYNTTNSTKMNLNVTNVPDHPVLTQQPNISAKRNSIHHILINLTDFDLAAPGDTITFTINESGPDFNITKLSDTQANLSYFKSTTGVFSIFLNASDQYGLNDTMEFMITIRDNLPPVIYTSSITVNTTDPLVMQVNATDPDGDPMTFNFSLTWGNLSNFNLTSTGIINFKGLENETGTHYINITAYDGLNTTIKNVTVIIQKINFPPVWNLSNMVAFANQTFSYLINVTDPENDTISVSYSFIGNAMSNFVMNASGWINFTPLNNESARYMINFSMNDSSHNPIYAAVNFTLYWINRAPTISSWNMSFPLINVIEGDTLGFNVTATDLDMTYFDNLTYSWLLDGVNQTSGLGNQSYLGNTSTMGFRWYTGFCTAGTRNITVIVEDALNLTSQYSWNVSVNNTNRVPYFGFITRNNATYFNQGTLYNTSVARDGTIVMNNASNTSFHTVGSYYSATVNLGDNAANLSLFHWNASIPSQTDLYLKTRTSMDGNTWGNWSSRYNTSGTDFLSLPERYVQVMANFSTNNTNLTPTLFNYSFDIFISNKSITQNTILNPWLDLDFFFFDPDYIQCSGANKDPLNFTFSGQTDLTFTVDSNHQVRVVPDTDYYGTQTFTITVNDGYDNLTSHLIKFSIAQSSGSGSSTSASSTSSSGGGGGGTRYVYKTKTVTKPKEKIVTEYQNITLPEALDIIALSPVVIYENDTVVVPVLLRNEWNQTLSNISLYAEINGNFSTSFLQDNFPQLLPGEEQSTKLILSSYASLGNYELKVIAKVGSPSFNDSVTLFVNSIELGKKNESQLNTKITFARDLLQDNPMCLELNEELGRASSQVKSANYAGAAATIDLVMDTCRYLISQHNKAIDETPGNVFRRLSSSLMNNITFYGILLVFVATLATMLLITTRKPKLKKERKKKAKEKKEEEEAFEPFT
ncbi:MAG: PKD domain-containing protein [Nanoarchaeota archaeon]|nr:PKD domain-containing protein [Nanoarchaeota archaeon]